MRLEVWKSIGTDRAFGFDYSCHLFALFQQHMKFRAVIGVFQGTELIKLLLSIIPFLIHGRGLETHTSSAAFIQWLTPTNCDLSMLPRSLGTLVGET
jgi:hypothetical protein